MAEAALRIDQAAAASQLRRSRVAARRQGGPQKKRGQILPFRQTEGTVAPPAPRAYGSSLVSDEEMYNIPRSPEAEAANNLEKLRKEQGRKAQLQKIKTSNQQNLKNFISAPREAEAVPAEVAEREDFQEAQDEFQQQSLASLQRFRSQAQSRIQTVRQLQRTAKEFAEKAKKIKELIKKAKEGKDILWTGGRLSTSLDSPGETGWTAFTLGLLTSMYGSVKGIFYSASEFSNDEDSGQFLKGVLGFIEPSAARFHKLTGIAIHLYSIIGYLGLGVIFMLIMLLILIVGTLGYYVSSYAEIFAPYL